MPRLNRLHHIAIICSDYQRSRQFYTDILGFSIIAETFRPERHSWKLDLALNSVFTIELFSFPEAPQRPSYPEARGLRHIAFEVDDLDVAVADLAAKNVVTEPIRIDTITGKRFTFFADPDDLPIELYEK